MKLYVLRHGETLWNKERKLQGQKGSDLNEEGILLAEITRDGLKDVPFDLCYTSPLLRARHTAELVLEGRNVPILEEPRLMEIAFGIWEGRSCDLNHLEIPRETYLIFHEDPFSYIPPEGGESIRDVLARTGNFYQELVTDPSLQNKTILISTHGCAGRAFLHSVYEDKQDFWHGAVPMNCSVNIIEVRDGCGTLVESDKVYYGKEHYHNYYYDQWAAQRK